MIFHENKLTAQEFIPLIEEAGWGSEGFYEKFGFQKRPNDFQGNGMILYIKK